MTTDNLRSRFPEIPANVLASAQSDTESVLHQTDLALGFQHPRGFFGQFLAVWTEQSNHGYSPDLAGDTFWQFHLFAGYRFPRRQAEITLGVLNLADQDYRLSPMNYMLEPWRHRVFASFLKCYF